MAPNLFTYATKELSQDAFICWLLDWANANNAQANPLLQRAACRFLNELLLKHSMPPIDAPRVAVLKQRAGADIVAEVDERIALLIEDKTDSGEHGDQLQRNKKKVSKLFPSCKLLPTFVKTGDQSRYDEVEKAGYRLFLRSDFLTALRAGRDIGVSNAIFIDFCENLEQLEARVQSYAHLPLSEWADSKGRDPRVRDPWVGFYEYLQSRKKDLRWGYIPNPTGGLFGARWHALNWAGYKVYLHIEQGPLCFKISVKDKSKRSEIRDRWHDKLMETAKSAGALNLKRPDRFGLGHRMRVAYINRPEWLMGMPDGRIDCGMTMQQLEAAEQLLEAAIR